MVKGLKKLFKCAYLRGRFYKNEHYMCHYYLLRHHFQHKNVLLSLSVSSPRYKIKRSLSSDSMSDVRRSGCRKVNMFEGSIWALGGSGDKWGVRFPCLKNKLIDNVYLLIIGLSDNRTFALYDILTSGPSDIRAFGHVNSNSFFHNFGVAIVYSFSNIKITSRDVQMTLLYVYVCDANRTLTRSRK